MLHGMLLALKEACDTPLVRFGHVSDFSGIRIPIFTQGLKDNENLAWINSTRGEGMKWGH